eukprot:7844810-Pyramimonas_sp.AAC.1
MFYEYVYPFFASRFCSITPLDESTLSRRCPGEATCRWCVFFPAAAAACSSVMLGAFKTHAQRARQKLRTLGRGSKKWWKISNGLLSHVHKPSSSPLKPPDGSWAFSASAKADVFARAFSSKWRLPGTVQNEFTDVSIAVVSLDRWGPNIIRTRSARAILSSLKQDSGTGPDLLLARVLEKRAGSLAVP